MISLKQARFRQLAGSLAVLQIADAIVSATPQMSMAARLDHLRVPEALRPLLPVIKVSTSLGLLVGMRRPRVGALTCAALVAFYASAVGFHGFAGDRPAVALPAGAFGASAGLCLVRYFLPASAANEAKAVGGPSSRRRRIAMAQSSAGLVDVSTSRS